MRIVQPTSHTDIRPSDTSTSAKGFPVPLTTLHLCDDGRTGQPNGHQRATAEGKQPSDGDLIATVTQEVRG